MNTKQVCKQLSVTPKMLRVYEEGGLIHPHRGENNYREYTEGDALRIQLIVMLRNLGFSVKEIGRIFKEKQDDREGVLYAFYFQLKAIELQQQALEQKRMNITAAINQMLAGTDALNCLQLQEPEPMYESIRSQWNFDEMAENYVSRFLVEDTEYQAGIQEARRFLLAMPRDSRILDAGGGTCYLWKELPGFSRVTILDNSLPMLLYARQNISAERYLLQDVLDSPQEKEYYDVVISTFLLHHLTYEQQEVALEHLLRVKKKQGVLYIVDRFFQSEEEKMRMRQVYEKTGNQRGILEIDAECFPMIGTIVEILQKKGCLVDVKKEGQFVRCLEIRTDA